MSLNMNGLGVEARLKNVLIVSRKISPFLWALKRVLEECKKEVIFPTQDTFNNVLLNNSVSETIIIINADENVESMMAEWFWRRIRLNKKNLGKYAGVPIFVFGYGSRFIIAVIRKMPSHHSYFTKPLNLRKFTLQMENSTFIRPIDLLYTLKYKPDELVETLQDSHNLGRLTDSRFINSLLQMTDEKIIKEIEDKNRDIVELEMYDISPKKIKDYKTQINELIKKIKEKRGDLWKE